MDTRAPRGETEARGERMPGRHDSTGASPRFARRFEAAVGFPALATIVILLGVWARVLTWDSVFGGGQTELVPADSHYYVRLALLHLSELRPVDVDPFVAFPAGAANYWPPLHTLLVALLVGGPADPETGAAFVGPIGALLGLVAVALVGRSTIGQRATLFTLVVLALTPIAIESGALGNADHHVHEPTFAALTLLLAAAGIRGTDRAAIGAGLVAAGARFFTTVGFVLPGIVAVGFVGAALASPRECRGGIARRALFTGAASTGLLAIGVLALGRPLALDYESLSAFHPLLSAAVFGAAVTACAILAGDRRIAGYAAPFALAGVPLVVELGRAAQHLGRVDPLIAIVGEATPLATNPVWAILLFGPILFALPFALIGAAIAVFRRESPEIIAPLLATLIFLAGAALQVRFAPLLAGAASVLLPTGIGALLTRVPSRGRPWVGGALAVASISLIAVLVPPRFPRAPGPAEQIRPTLRWMRDNLPPAAADPYDIDAVPSYGVLAPFEYGHFLVLYAERPVVASTFSQTAGHVRANQTASEIFAATDEEDAFRRARGARLRYVLHAPTVALLGVSAPDRDALYFRLARGEPMGHFRAIYQSAERQQPGGGSAATVYEVVTGAVLTGSALPGATVTAIAPGGYARTTIAGADGIYRVRVAHAGLYVVTSGRRLRRLEVNEVQVQGGDSVPVDGSGS